jgi:GMP synthase (glutamine-hydrolysing)
VVAFRHVPFEHAGRIADSLAENGIGCQYVDLYHADADVSVRDTGGLIFMGGPMSVNDDLPYLRQEMRMIAQAISYGKPVMGVCLGSQLIARALGASVYPNPVKEIGWFPVHFTTAAGEDALFRGLREPEMIFHWHGETFDLPHGAELLASSDACRHQAFRVGKNVYDLQFHLEVTPEMIADWCLQDANCGDMRELTRPIDAHANAARLAELSRQVFGRWCELIP